MAPVPNTPATEQRVPIPVDLDNSNIIRDSFPKGFIFGAATSAFQVEGAVTEGGKGLSTWDTFATKTPSTIVDGSNGNVAADMYNRYKEDIRAMKAMGFDSYRFSISWSRILPGMKPFVTLFHWDLPDCLEKEYGGFLSKKVVDDFCEFADLCFWEFGDRVKFWTTLNEPWTVAVHGYVSGTFPPSKPSCSAEKTLKNLPPHRCIQDQEQIEKIIRNSAENNSHKNAYIAARNLLLCHAAAVRLYRTTYKTYQEGEIGIVLNSLWFVPLNEFSPEDKAAARRALDFMIGWYLDPILNGRYPQSMIQYVPEDASFTSEDWNMVKGSTDFVGLNYYTTNYVSHVSNPPEGEGYVEDKKIAYHTKRDGIPIGQPSGSTWLTIVPWGIYELLVFLKNTYPNIPPIYITENGVSDKHNYKLTALQASHDTCRVKYHQDHLACIRHAINHNQVKVKGYFVWSWCDNFEWTEGYMSRFGIMYTDFINNQTRYPKDSAVWLAHFLHNKKMRKLCGSTICPKELANKRQTEVKNHE